MLGLPDDGFDPGHFDAITGHAGLSVLGQDQRHRCCERGMGLKRFALHHCVATRFCPLSAALDGVVLEALPVSRRRQGSSRLSGRRSQRMSPSVEEEESARGITGLGTAHGGIGM